MGQTKYVMFENRMPELPLLSNYICFFESVSGTTIAPEDFDDLKNSNSQICVVLTSTGELMNRTTGDDETEVLLQFADGDAIMLVLRSFLNGPSLRIPLESGRFFSETENWEYSDQKMIAQIVKPVPSGFLVRVHEERAFLPNSYIPSESKGKPDGLVERVFECEVVFSDGKHSPVVKPKGPFIAFEDLNQLFLNKRSDQ